MTRSCHPRKRAPSDCARAPIFRVAFHPKAGFGVGGEGSLTFDVARVTEPIRPDDVAKRVHPALRPYVVFDQWHFRVLSCLVAIGGSAHGSAGCGADGVVRF
jgi:hypothetical protein